MPSDEKKSTRQRILTAAQDVFGDLGFARATTRGIAATAGITEVTLFRHFGNKKALFKAVMQRQAIGPVLIAVKASLTGDYRADLLRIGHFFIGVMVKRHGQIRLMLCEASHFPDVAEVMADNPRRLRQLLAGYLEEQMAAGVVRPGHAEAMAQAFWGMFFAWGIGQGVLNQALEPELDNEGLVEQFVDLFVAGTLVERGAS